jgi:peptidoglycan/xylan/chitin deacetylase (PgdA/CDA1 family)
MADTLLVLGWHAVDATWEYPSRPGTAVRGLEHQLRWLLRAGNVVALEQALDGLHAGRPLPPRAIALTFDDGYRDNLALAVPLLERLGLPATFFLVPGILSGEVRPWWELLGWAFAHSTRPTVRWDGMVLPTAGREGRRSLRGLAERLKLLDQVGREQTVAELCAHLEPRGEPDCASLFLDWAGARELVRRGFTVGSHSMRHAVLAREAAERQTDDLTAARRQLEQELGLRVRLLAYPNGTFGDYDENTVRAAEQAGYTHALTARPGLNRRSTPVYEARRVMLAPEQGFFETVVRRGACRWPGVTLHARTAAGVNGHDRAAPQTGLRLHTETMDTLRREWTQLAARTSNVFATWEWASTWWRHFGGRRRPLVTTCRAGDGTLVGILPLYPWVSTPLRIVRFIGHGPADQLGPVHAPEHLAAIVCATREALAAMHWAIFVGEKLPADAGWSGLLDAPVVARDGNAVLHAPNGGWDAFLAGRSPNFRQQVRRRERQLARDHRVVYRLVQDPEELPRVLDTLFHLHALRWPPGTSAFLPRAAFHRDFAAVALRQGWLRLWLLELDGRPAAALYGLRFGGVECYYQSGRDPAFGRLSVGFALLAHSIRSAFDEGVTAYRLLHGHEAFKYRFADEDPGFETIALTRGLAGRAALDAVFRSYPHAKRRLGRLRWAIT